MRDLKLTIGPLEVTFEWDHGPDLTITFFGRRTHIIGYGGARIQYSEEPESIKTVGTEIGTEV